MKTLEQCMAENSEFLNALTVLVREALNAGEYQDTHVFVFIKDDENQLPVPVSIVTGYEITIYGNTLTLLNTGGLTLKELNQC